MLIEHVQAAPNSDGSFHIQATGPSFPLGYTSGDVDLEDIKPASSVFVPSMRGSGRLYFVLTPDQVDDYLVEIVSALHAPRPQYSSSQVAEVEARVKASLAAAQAGIPTPVASTPDVDETLVAKIVKAVLAALKS
jgi:hypothetical protein